MGKAKQGKQLSLSEAFLLTKSGRESELSQVASNSERLDLNVDGNEDLPIETEDRKKQRKDSYICTFLSSWKLSHPWAYSIIDNDGKECMKCTLCVEAKEKDPFANEGNINIQKGALHDHAISEPHKNAVRKLTMLAKLPQRVIEKHVELMVDSEKNRIVTVMQVLWDKVVSDGSIESFEHACKFHVFMGTPQMPLLNEYSSYTNANTGKEFLKAMHQVYWERLRDDICKSPYFSIMVDESMDRQYEKHLIMYIMYLKDGGFGPCVTRFVRLVRIKDGKAQSMFDAIMELFADMKLDKKKLVGFASDGASSMVGIHEGLVTKLRCEVCV
ncbi:hypothetical protein L7F22_067287 [Adiantum nelumboides]|nr:hypothetical protein [Adiantum nelumboides]